MTYEYGAVVANHYGPTPDGSVDATGYWLFEPADPGSTPVAGPVPLIIFFHASYGTDPTHYRAWIDHLVRRGAVVVYPDFQPLPDGLMKMCPTSCPESEHPTLPPALTAIRAALAELENGSHVPADLTRVGVAGHSIGAVLAAKYAAIAGDEGLPVPAALFVMMPGCECDFANEIGTIPSTTRVIVLVNKEDGMVTEDMARTMWTTMADVPLDQRDYIRLVSDTHGQPPLIAEHPLPTTDGDWDPLDAYDWYGTWKFFDGLLSCSFSGADCQYALGNTAEQRFMGVWSDGFPVVEPEVTNDPATLPN
jgi:acetyl esterase/lipase